MLRDYLYIFFLLLLTENISAQETIIKGRVTDSETAEPLPFVNIFINESNIGTHTDFDGFYTIKTNDPKDSLSASFFGYVTKTKLIKKGITQTIDFQLTIDIKSLEEIVITGTENPAFAILRKVIENKDKNDKRKLLSYEYESFNRVEINVDNISDRFRKKKVMKKIGEVFDSLETRAGEDGKPVLPVFVSEALSNYYHRTNPEKTKEVILATKVSGIGISDGSLSSQLIGSSFQEYNFYKNWLNIVEKDFISPIADAWNGYYEYVLDDSMFVGDKWCYKIDFKPKRAQDLAFSGTMWITDTTYALKQIEANVDKKANINHLEKIKIQQELQQTSVGPWLPIKTRVLIDLVEIKKNSAGMLGKFYTSNRYFNVNNPRPAEFYDKLLIVEEDATLKGKEFWDERRHDSLTATDKYIYSMVDSIKNVPIVKTYIEILNIAVNGYKKIGKIDVGPYLYIYSKNDIEGHRFRIGLRTNIDFSKKWVFKGYLAYGTKDERFKYGLEANYILSRKDWTVIGFERKQDIDQVARSWDALNYSGNNLFLGVSKWGTLRGPFLTTQNTFRIQRAYTKDFSQKLTIRNITFDPLYPFAYYTDLSKNDSTLKSVFSTSEIILESRYAKDEFFLQNDNERISLGTKKWPVFTLRYTLGIKNFLGGDFNYQKLSLDINHVVKWGTFGRTYYNFSAKHIFSPVPYPLLEVHIGNESAFYTSAAFSLMDYFEFVSDSYVSLKYMHYFEGLLFNRIPVVKKLKWRFLTTGSIIYGGISKKNMSLIPPVDQNGEKTQVFSSLSEKPYIEIGYGIDNIFKVIRINAFHRLTYLDKPDVNKFGVKISFQFII